MRALGLLSALEEKISNDAAAGFGGDYKSNDIELGGRKGSRKKRKRTTETVEIKEPTRKSSRLQGISGETLIPLPKMRSDPESIQKEREDRVKECREARLKAAKEIAEYGPEAAGKKNPTATYEHCLMRVRSMTDKGLANRVKAIERAAGKHCVVKMAIFKSCLQDEGLWSLAELASEALERLKELKPIPE